MDSQNLGAKSKIICRRCSNEVHSGSGHGDNLGFPFRYCQTYNEFVACDRFGMESPKT